MPCYQDQLNQDQIVNLLKENWAAEPKKFQDLWAEVYHVLAELVVNDTPDCANTIAADVRIPI
jgi:hypothetical protein